MILTKSPISLHDPAGPTPRMALASLLSAFQRFSFFPVTPALRAGLGGRSIAQLSTGSINGLHSNNSTAFPPKAIY